MQFINRTAAKTKYAKRRREAIVLRTWPTEDARRRRFAGAAMTETGRGPICVPTPNPDRAPLPGPDPRPRHYCCGGTPDPIWRPRSTIIVGPTPEISHRVGTPFFVDAP